MEGQVPNISEPKKKRDHHVNATVAFRNATVAFRNETVAFRNETVEEEERDGRVSK